ncbi:toxin YoeB [Planctomycetales bacterium]|nr:toxin YoeB [Planctomycetales bacterium]
MNLKFTPTGWQHYLSWQTDKKTLAKINRLLADILRNPFTGLGKPEALRGDKFGAWSRRIDDANRVVYRLVRDEIEIEQCRGHYDDK